LRYGLVRAGNDGRVWRAGGRPVGGDRTCKGGKSFEVLDEGLPAGSWT
jgi:hypothetical protein